ncbi:putative PhoU-like phosphate regulatory protein [Encephalitozoon intestinalis]|uniref:Uncharacterized protein n=1 Tax=Encephalitozoon intestinalis TaxID=58839 RepID=K9NRG5_ENCIN|nr:hypothetical protein Eint_051610 [Encephalitozoon intestinalis]
MRLLYQSVLGLMFLVSIHASDSKGASGGESKVDQGNPSLEPSYKYVALAVKVKEHSNLYLRVSSRIQNVIKACNEGKVALEENHLRLYKSLGELSELLFKSWNDFSSLLEQGAELKDLKRELLDITKLESRVIQISAELNIEILVNEDFLREFNEHAENNDHKAFAELLGDMMVSVRESLLLRVSKGKEAEEKQQEEQEQQQQQGEQEQHREQE